MMLQYMLSRYIYIYIFDVIFLFLDYPILPITNSFTECSFHPCVCHLEFCSFGSKRLSFPTSLSELRVRQPELRKTRRVSQREKKSWSGKFTGNPSKGFIKQQGPRMFLMEVENVPCAGERLSISFNVCTEL